MIVLDASAALEAVLGTSAATDLRERLLDPGQALHAPHLLDIEVAQVLRRYARAGDIGPDRCRSAMEDFLAFRLNRYSHAFLLPRVWELRDNLTAYDAVYVALAEVLDAVLLTCDRRLAAAPGHHARIELV